jgi:outer membrane lipoprotein-sorting protein
LELFNFTAGISMNEQTTQTRQTNHGYLFRINAKRSEKAPDMEGEAWVGEARYQIAGWVNVSKKGRKYLNLKFTLSSGKEKPA